DIIINCVGENTDQKFMYSRNYKFVKQILNLIENSKKKKFLIHLSSCAVYGKYFHFKNYIINEKTDPSPISKYAKTKLKGDAIIINNKNQYLKYSLIRPSQVVGLNMNALGFINLVKFVKRKLFVYVSSKNAVRNYVNSEDLTLLIYNICVSNKVRNNIYIISRYSKLQKIIKLIQRQLDVNNFIDITVPKFILIYIVNIVRFFVKKFPVNKEIVEGLSITAKIKSNIYSDFKGMKLKNINSYLLKISK
ncbi:NAD-dependent epimerase/dehydratase family protein, partial [Candidatus Pelagibacter sp.]|nr:NAD-dependent epimerase/dehydratase family protein [Candidatus Pelagibacter sp.]